MNLREGYRFFKTKKGWKIVSNCPEHCTFYIYPTKYGREYPFQVVKIKVKKVDEEELEK